MYLPYPRASAPAGRNRGHHFTRLRVGGGVASRSTRSRRLFAAPFEGLHGRPAMCEEGYEGMWCSGVRSRVIIGNYRPQPAGPRVLPIRCIAVILTPNELFVGVIAHC